MSFAEIPNLFCSISNYVWGSNFSLLSFQDLRGLDEYRAVLKSVNDYISEVENKVTTKLETIDRFADPQDEYKTSQVNP